MQLRVSSMSYHKSEGTSLTNADALAVDLAAGVFAVADGVSGARHSRIWAQLIADYYLEHPLLHEDRFEVEHWLRHAQKRLTGQLPPPPAPKGAATTLSGLRIVPLSEDRFGYMIEAIGDSNFFHWRRNEDNSYSLHFAFPLNSASDFDDWPASINSRLVNRDRTILQRHEDRTATALRSGDILMLATDAVAKWILQTTNGTSAQSGELVSTLLELTANSTADSWCRLVDQLREPRLLDDDDSTLVLIEVLDQPNPDDLHPRPGSAYIAAQMASRMQELRDALGGWLDGRNDTEVAVAIGAAASLTAPTRQRLTAQYRLGTALVSHLQLWQAQADAFKHLVDVLRRYCDSNEQRLRDELEQVWNAKRAQLLGLPWVNPVLETIRLKGLEPPVLATGMSPDLPESLITDGVAHELALRQERSQGLRSAILNWAEGKAGAQEILRYFTDSESMIEPVLQMVISRPIELGEIGAFSHVQLWQAEGSPDPIVGRPDPDQQENLSSTGVADT